MRKHKKVSISSVFLATSGKQVSDETTEVLHEPNFASYEANQALREPKSQMGLS